MYVRDFAPIDPRLRKLAELPAQQWMFDYKHFGQHFVRHDPVYDMLRRADIRYAAGIRFEDSRVCSTL